MSLCGLCANFKACNDECDGLLSPFESFSEVDGCTLFTEQMLNVKVSLCQREIDKYLETGKLPPNVYKRVCKAVERAFGQQTQEVRDAIIKKYLGEEGYNNDIIITY